MSRLAIRLTLYPVPNLHSAVELAPESYVYYICRIDCHEGPGQVTNYAVAT